MGRLASSMNADGISDWESKRPARVDGRTFNASKTTTAVVTALRNRALGTVNVGDTIIIAAYAYLEDGEVESFTPKIVLMEKGNRIAGIN